ncbi:hypothetical protein BKA62DRAFT_711289 [Auriculariales sp. MPI-PUGE-AT-0066]|nr:hypothetical protein BKA62DRAFT_711289 [Auriculariales sp. MPI-PUGE-AT-0066]
MTEVNNGRFDQPPANFNPEQNLGPWLIGGLLEMLLGGAVLTLSVAYHQVYASADRAGLRVLAVALTVLSVLRSMQVAAMVWMKLVFGWGSYAVVSTYVPWYVSLDALLSVIITLLAQGFFLKRLHAISKNLLWLRWVFLLIGISMALGMGAGIALMVFLFDVRGFAVGRRFQITQAIGYGGQIAADVLISGTLGFVLFKSKTGMPRTDSMVHRIILLSWTTAAIPALNGIAKLIAQMGFFPSSTVFIAFSFMQSKLYALAVLVTLCGRQWLRASDPTFISTLPLSMSRGRQMGLADHSMETSHEIHFIEYDDLEMQDQPSESSTSDTKGKAISRTTYELEGRGIERSKDIGFAQ